MSNKKILFTLPNLEAGGAERVLLNIARKLNPEEYNMELLVIDQFGELENYVPEYVNIINLDTRRTRNALVKMIKYLNRTKPDIIFSTTNRVNLLVLIASFFLIKKPKILIREPNTPSAQFGQKYLNKYYFLLMKLLYPVADIIIAQTNDMKEELISMFNINKEKIEVVSNPIDPSYIDQQVEGKKSPYNNDCINIVASGRLHKQKGFDILISAFQKVTEKNDKFRLFIIGKKHGNENCTDSLNNLIMDYKLENYIILAGFQENPYNYYKNADLFVLSSRWEGMPNVVLESLYLGTPVVATRCVPIISELIQDGITGKICDVENANQIANGILDYKKYIKPSKINLEESDINSLFQNL